MRYTSVMYLENYILQYVMWVVDFDQMKIQEKTYLYRKK